MVLPVVAFLLIPAAMQAQEAPPGGIVGYWAFDTFKGRLTPDLSGNVNDAIVLEATQVKGVRGGGLAFDGYRTSVRCAPSTSLDLTTALSIEAWVKLHSTDFRRYPAVVRKDGAYALRFGGKTLAFVLWMNGNPAYLNSAKSDWAPEQWYHLAATFDGTQMRLFIDGAEDKNSPQRQPGEVDVSMHPCGIGSMRSQYLFDGVIDEVRIFNRAVSPEEVKKSFRAGRASIQAEKDMAFKPKMVGDTPPVFRKPRRAITRVEEGFIWIDAEDFADYGGWCLDTQFVHLMGSAYLIASGIGKPVADATVKVDIPQAGTYRLWVRAKNWLKDYAPGQFKVIVGEKATDKTFGKAQDEAWLWESGGDFDLPQGKVKIALHDLTGYYGRCDALVLTTDRDYVPPADVAQINTERARLTGLSLEPKLVGEFDVIVVGAGSAGCPAALAAARMGAKTALIQNRPVLGGNSSIECGVPICGAASAHPNARESGIIEEIGRIKARYGYPKMSAPFRIAAEKEKNLQVFINNHVYAVEMKNDKEIAAVKAVNTLTNEITRYKGKYFIDCTGDGWVGYFAKAKFHFGRESRDEYDEDLAPEKADQITMSGCIMGRRALSYRAEDMGKPMPYTPPPWAPKFPPEKEFGRKPRGFASGQWWLEHRGTINDVWDAEKARDELIRITYGYWDYIKNTWPEKDRAKNYALTFVPIVDAKRESRRLIGDYVLTQNDVQSARQFPDAISYGGWPIDVHNPEGVFSGTAGPFYCDPYAPIYTIPYRCLYSVNIDNLLFAGRCMSVTHIALGTVRVQGTLATTGQAAGTAAAMCVRWNTPPRGIYENRMKEFQQLLLKNDQYIPNIKNEDPNDLARKAKVSASSTARYDEFTRRDVQKARDVHPLNMIRAVMFPRGVKKDFKSIFLLLRSENDTPTAVTLHVREAPTPNDFSSTKDIATATAKVPPGVETWVEFTVNCTIEAPFAYAWLPPIKGISWRLMQTAPIGSCRAYGGWTVRKGQYYAFATDPPLAVEADYRPENIINGMTRIIDATMNMWASDPEQPMPQWVELDFDGPTEINTVYLIFDTDMNTKYHTIPIVRQCVRDYELSYYDGQKWTTLATEKGNFQRRRVHHFDTVAATKLRLTVHATNGDKSARVFELRAYKE
ncbi:MAG: FAD-dependent oxidoreductase [Planctomycetes bacterium]|nr:FAD-dependent oxidoreductase [Planctomycetota bacterium]